ncbi:MAG: carbamoyltransferase HypF, partial [Chloroflexi bacterium]|nr:carbamoyltransferase HypF [Chloroflexota bacterium]
SALARFLRELSDKAPPIARIESVVAREIPANGYRTFEILHSETQAGVYQLVSPDMATCPDCLRELRDPHDRRYRYPFTNCTNCGPRFTIIEDVPYDRPRTTMRAFRMCPDCQREYDDPLDRRCHAQPNACPICGPHLMLLDGEGRPLAQRDEALDQAVRLLRQGGTLAIKGLGGYQLACDATKATAVSRLRARKRRPHKPFAVMVRDIAEAEAHAELGDTERELLRSPAAPIVLVPWREDSTIAHEAAPATRAIGVMLPYTPLHHLLLDDVQVPLVMTSGNLSEEPIARDNEEALRRLGGIADGFLTHNRDIRSRYDDSVWFVSGAVAQPVRRARGYAPFPVRLPFATRPILAWGPELKNTFCLTREGYAFLSQHIGDMENLETWEHYQETLALYRALFRVEPVIVAHDLHPDYMTTRFAREQVQPKVAVQHHHAHLAACLADNGEMTPAIGVIMDGTGYGLDGRIWGGEFLVGDGRGFQRAAHLQYLPLPGGDQAIRKPYRIALAYWRALLGDRPLPSTLRGISAAEVEAIETMVARGLNAPLTSSAGRLFDAVSALLGVCPQASYEAQAAIELEMVADDRRSDAAPYPYAVTEGGEALRWGRVERWVDTTLELGLAPLFEALADEMDAGTPV